MGYLYKLDFSSGKSYIGITQSKRFASRIAGHRCDASTRSNYLVHKAWRKYGEPKVKILAIATGDFLVELERRAIKIYKTFGDGGYNLTPGGEIPTMTPEIRHKIRISAIGRIVSQETRAKMSARRKGQRFSAEARAKMSKYALTRTYSLETRAKLSAAAKVRIFTPETRAKMSAYGKTKIFTEQHRARIAAAKTGSKHSQETIAKLIAIKKRKKENI